MYENVDEIVRLSVSLIKELLDNNCWLYQYREADRIVELDQPHLGIRSIVEWNVGMIVPNLLPHTKEEYIRYETILY